MYVWGFPDNQFQDTTIGVALYYTQNSTETRDQCLNNPERYFSSIADIQSVEINISVCSWPEDH